VGILWSGLLRHSLTDEVSARFLGAVADELAPTGLSLTLLPPGDDDAGVVPARDVAMDGAIVYTVQDGSPAVRWLRRRGLPLVFVDSPAPEGSPAVHVDDRGGARLAAEHLVALGHRRIGILSAGFGPVPGPVAGGLAGLATDALGLVSRERLRGWLEGLSTAGIEPVLAAQPNSYEDARPAARLLLDAVPDLTAVLCLSDVIAHDVLRAAEERGLTVPGDLSVVGFDDNPLAARSTPGLTTVRQDVDAKGHAAAAALRLALARRDDDAPVPSTLLPVELVVRGSTAAPRR
jgi:DNA-binding LacI/PurR family transcriptional regulator